MNLNLISKNVCSHFKTCSGCSLDLNAEIPPIWNDVLSFFDEKNIATLQLHEGDKVHWRNRAKLAVRGTAELPLIGLFKEGTHTVLPIPFCLIHHPNINKAIEVLKLLIQKHNLAPYNESTGGGDLRYVQFAVQRKTGKVQATFVLNLKDLAGEQGKKWQSLLVELGNDQQSFWHSIWINLNNRSTNTIFGSDWTLCYGQELLWEIFGEVSVSFHPGSFAQANLDLFERMLHHMKELIQPERKIAEFYAGVGVIGLFLASQCQWIRCAEINPSAELCFSKSKERLPIGLSEKISFKTGPSNTLLNILQDADVAIVDPPRKGLDSLLLKALNTSPTLEQIIYVSCGWESFKRDCHALLEAGWQVANAKGYWFFPGTNHIEILANFRR